MEGVGLQQQLKTVGETLSQRVGRSVGQRQQLFSTSKVTNKAKVETTSAE